MQTIKDGIEEYSKELVREKSKRLIPPFDMDKFENRHINVEPDETGKSKDKDREIDI